MRVVIDNPIPLETSQKDRKFLKGCCIWYNEGCVLPQKCDLPEDKIWEFLHMLEGCNYGVELVMYNIGRFKLDVS